MFDKIKEIFANILKSRILILTIMMFVLTFILVQRMVKLQIINGQKYLDNYSLKIEKTRDLASTRGNIYDRNGKLLAYSELAYAVVLEDNGTYSDKEEKNKKLNSELYQLLKILDKNKDSIKNDFYISYSKEEGYQFTVSGSTLKRFLADIYDH
ncbi:MAG: peptidoglycan glycosyltransferase, partial [Lachnospiraceae bacterium]|nr:peptidoglycan glycosyltransferase [Lachnospiraceae bacterium]